MPIKIKNPFSNKEYLQKIAAELQPELSYLTKGRDNYPIWRTQLRAKIIELIGGFPDKVPLNPRILDEVKEDDYIRRKVAFDTEPGVSVPAYLLIPDKLRTSDKNRAMLCLHGHGYGITELVGVAPNEEIEEHIKVHNSDYARQFAKRGYVVLAPEARGFGERADGSEDGCHIPGVIALFLGKPVTGLRTWDDMRALDYLSSLPKVDPERIGCVGLSEGGKRTMYLSALDDRIKVAIISGYFSSFRLEVGKWKTYGYHDICNYIQGLLRYADYPDIVSLIADRPLLIEYGNKDPLYSLDVVESAYKMVQEAYKDMGAEDKIDIDIFEGEHQFSGAKAFAWVDKWL